MRIQLHGYLKELHPEPIEVHASSVAEAISSLQLLPAFSPKTGKKHHVIIDGYSSPDAIYDKDHPPEVIDIRPVAAGAGNGGLGRIIMGIILIVVTYFSAGSMTAQTAQMMYMAGAMMILGGILEMMAPQPKFDAGTQTRSQYLGGSGNTVAIGTRIPMIYGRCKAYGHYVSFDMDTGDLNSAPASWYSSPFTDYGETTYSAAPAELPIPPVSLYDGQPESVFQGLAYPAELTTEDTTYITFSPAVQLNEGQWDINFNNGQTLHVFCSSAAPVTQVTLIGGSVVGLPPVGTPIIFTQNYG